MAAVGVASAQSTATISGTFGAAYQTFQDGEDDIKGFVQADSSIKFTAVEDLGGGLKATAAVQFTLGDERGNDESVQKEDSSVALSGSLGTLTFANTRTSNTAIGAHVFASWMPKNFYNQAVEGTRTNVDSLSYVSPELVPGLRLGYSLIELEDGDGTSENKVNVLSGTYASGPFTAALAYKMFNAVAVDDLGVEKNRTEVALTYDLGMAKVGLGYGTRRTAADKGLTTVGVTVPLGALTVGVNYASRGSVGNFYEAGAVYALSKRTSAQAMVGKITGGDFDGQQYRVGVVHTF